MTEKEKTSNDNARCGNKKKTGALKMDDDISSKTHDELLVLVGNLKHQLNLKNKNNDGQQNEGKPTNSQGCNHCKEAGYSLWRKHTEDRCWKLHPELRPAPDGTVTPDPSRLGPKETVPRIGTVAICNGIGPISLE
jgi:hypothetical protein